MDLNKIKALLDYMGGSRVQEMRVTQDGTTVVIRNAPVHPPTSMSSTMASIGTAVSREAGSKEAAVETRTMGVSQNWRSAALSQYRPCLYALLTF